MAMDGLALRSVVAELQTLIGGKIDKVQQPENDLVLLTIRTERTNRRLFIHTHAENGRIQYTEQSFDNPMNAPAFCMLLRRHLLGGRITAVTQDGLDRICTIFISARNEMLDDVQLRMVVELMGKHANLTLVGGDGKILDCLRHISPSETSLRVMLPGFSYEPAPSQQKQDPFSATLEDWFTILHAPNPVRQLTDTYEGISRFTAQSLLAGFPNESLLLNEFARFKEDTYQPAIVYQADGEPVSVLPFAPQNMGSQTVIVSTMCEALDRFYAERDAAVRIRRHGASLKRTVENALARAEHKYASFTEAIQNEEKLETLRFYGELILANLYQAKPGMQQLIADNYYIDPPEKIAIPLDAAISLQENANKYFKQYRKGKLARDYAQKQMETVLGEIQYLSGQIINIGNCDTLAELEEIREELTAQKYVKPDKKSGKKQFSQPSKLLCFQSSDGIGIFVGKNNRQNEQLTLRQAKGENLWLHAKNMTGSHVVVDFEGTPPEQTILEAATLAAYYSSGRAATTVPVDYTPRKYIKKPSGARPGMVIYSTNKTVYVAPDAKVIAELIKRQP